MGTKLGTGQGGIRYPWTKWLKKKRFVIKRGKHFDCMVHSMAQQVRNAARLEGYTVSIRVKEDKLEVTPTKRRK